LTVTEGGYFLRDGKFDTAHPAIQHDMANADQPKTVFGLLVQALKERRAQNIAPFTVMSCDNVPHNGDIAQTAVLGMAKGMDPELADWIAQHVTFPNSMVDRITPATGDAERAFVANELGYTDAVPVFCEPYRQWVLEDKFVNNERPALEQVGVQFVEHVTPYENAKIRILNGGHASLAYPSALLDVEYVHQAMEHPLIGPFLDQLERTEILPHVPAVPDTDLVKYWETIRARFSNSTINDRIDRNCADGSNRQPKFIVSNLKASLDAGGKVEGLALVCALWCRYHKTTLGENLSEGGKGYQVLAPQLAHLQQVAPEQWLDAVDIYEPVRQHPALREAFTRQIQVVMQPGGVEKALQQYITGSK